MCAANAVAYRLWYLAAAPIRVYNMVLQTCLIVAARNARSCQLLRRAYPRPRARCVCVQYLRPVATAVVAASAFRITSSVGARLVVNLELRARAR